MCSCNDSDEYQNFDSIYDMEYMRRISENTIHAPEVGDRVLVAIGLLGFGTICARDEGIVLECASTSYRVQFANPENPRRKPELWVHQNFITDILKPRKSANKMFGIRKKA